MASSSGDQQSQSKAGEPPSPPRSSSAANNPPPIYPPPSVGYPPGPHPGYPPAMGYPHYGAPPPYNGYAYAQAPPAAYYHGQNYPAEPVNAGFIRGIVSALILVVLLLTLSSIITWIMLRPEIPIFKVESFSVGNFNISKSNYSGSWEAAVGVENPNRKLNLNFERIQSFVDFKEHTLAMSFGDPFFLDVEKSTKMRVRLISSSPDDPGNWADIEDKMGRERAAGTVGFNLRFLAWTTFRSGSWWTRRVIMRIFCEDLKLAFAGPAARDAKFVADSHPKTCSVYV